MRRRGSYAVEFALVLPIFVAAIGGVVEYGRYFDRQVTMVGILRNVTRSAAMVPAGQSPVKTAIGLTREEVAAQGFTGALTVDAHLVGVAPHQLVVVSASIPYQPLIGLVPTPKVVGYSAVMRMNDQP